jgi:putative ATPase
MSKKTENKAFKRPLADILRPKKLSQILGQNHLFGEFGALSLIESSKNVPSMIFYGPAGVGKTSIAKLLADVANTNFKMISAINSGVAEIRKIIDQIIDEGNKNDLLSDKKPTILMVDEIHHFNKTQQDLFLPFIENGTIIFIGTTTENPSFALNSALLSRCKVLSLNSLDDESLRSMFQKVEEHCEKKLPIDKEAKDALISLACGDGRYFLNICEEILSYNGKEILSKDALLQLVRKRSAHFDNKGEFHYNLISALHKSLRGSDVDASLYYLSRMIVAGADPYYILRRLARFATEDVGIADPNALLQVMAAKENYDFLGSFEGNYALSHAVIYLATAPKSNASYMAHKAAIALAESSVQIQPPKHILNAPTKLMKEQGFGKGYIYDHDAKDAFSGQEFFPDELLKKGRPSLYQPNERGFEREVKKRMQYWQDLRQKKNR